MSNIYRTFCYSESQSYEDTVENLRDGFEKLGIVTLKTGKNDESKIIKILSQFSNIKSYEKVTLLSSFIIPNNVYNTHLVLLTFNSFQEHVGSKSTRVIKNVDCELVGLTSLKFDIGHTYIRPESFRDKLMELINSVDIDFKEDKEFSRKYYMVSDDEEKVRKNIDLNFLKAVKQDRDMHIEIIDRYIILRTLKPVKFENMKTIVDMLKDINTINSNV